MERKRTPARYLRCAGAVSMTVLFLALPLHAQETRGRITGRVSDTTKAPISGASVEVKDVARGTTASSKTNSEGLFQAPYLLPGSYQVVVQSDGFKTYVKQDLRLQVNETRDLAITLEVGGMQETVSVSADAATLNTSDANMGFTVDQKRIAELPLIHGDPYKIMGLATGLTIGLCGGIGGLIVAGLGFLGDTAGLTPVFYALAALPLLVVVLASQLPRPEAAPAGTLWGLRD